MAWTAARSTPLWAELAAMPGSYAATVWEPLSYSARMRVRAIAVALVASLALLAAGCGKNDQPSTAAWTDDFCSAITTWQSSITSIVTSLQSSGLTKDSLTSAFDDAKSATNDLTSSLGDLGKPDSEAGQQAQDAVEQ